MPAVCNRERLRNISMGDEAFADELVRVFLDDAADQIDKLRAAVEQADWQQTAEVAHRLKGAGANIGAELLAEACQGLETEAMARSLDGLAQRLDAVDGEWRRACSTFESVLEVR